MSDFDEDSWQDGADYDPFSDDRDWRDDHDYDDNDDDY